jgi:hypothetical protein
MSFDSRDPRSTLPSANASPSAVVAGGEYVKFYERVPHDPADGHAKTWYARGQHFVVAYSDADANAVLARTEQPDEYMLLLLDPATRVEVITPDERVQVEGRSLVILPPGQTRVEAAVGGRLVRLFSARSQDLNAACSNADSYATPHGGVAEFEPWPAPPAGYRVRVYPVDVPRERGRFGRIWRCTTLMINWTEGAAGPRNVSRMSPHSHPDFEQGSLVIEGEYVHHLRWPWTTNLPDWRDDDHELCRSPSLTVIPPTSIHTSQAIGPEVNQLIDIFAPPRFDFSEKPGWVLNADDYPMPPVR